MSQIVEVKLWGSTIGYLGYAPEQTDVATFEYTGEFMRSHIFPSPILMRYPPARFVFPDISRRTFRGVPGICADSLPDKYGNQLIDIFMAEKKIPPEKITTLDRLLYVGTRGMGALEYHPAAAEEDEGHSSALDIHLLAELAEKVLAHKESLHQSLHDTKTRTEALRLIRIGSSAGGARSKALVAQAPDGRLYDGTLDLGCDHRYWLLKFDSSANSDRDGKDPKGMTKVEYLYSQIAKACGIEMPEVDCIVDGEDFHFLTERFDRDRSGPKLQKVHYASWAGLEHADRDSTGAYAYEQLVMLARKLGLGQESLNEIYRRAVFNVIGRNQDDHTKNFGFLMDKRGEWRLSPAFDMTYSYDPSGKWTQVHQIRLNGKQDGFALDDLIAFGSYCNLTPKKANKIIDDVRDAFQGFEKMAKELEIDPPLITMIHRTLRLDLA